MHLFAQKFSKSTFLILFTLWLFATVLNLNKAFHIDDTFHLEAAQWIEQNPLRPMSGLINWDSNSVPIYSYNQPPLYFYLVALVGSFLGFSEVPLHLLQSLFTLLAIVAFFKIATIIQPYHAIFLTILFVLNPAFLVNQNLMVDIPLLSLHLLFIYILVDPEFVISKIRYLIAAIILSIALLVKYTSLPLTILLLIVPFLRKEKKYAFVAFIPLLVLGAWSMFNLMEYGAIHLLNRPSKTPSVYAVSTKLLSLVLCLGAIAPFTIAYVTGFSKKYKRELATTTVLSVLMFLLVVWLWYADILTDRTTRHIFWGGFIVNGIIAVAIALNIPLHTLLHLKEFKRHTNTVIILLWGVGMGAFIVLFAPFMATRHVLLVIPAVLLLGSRILHKVASGFKALAIVVSLSLSLLLGISDWMNADFYREQASLIKKELPLNATVWFVGHWGWQWYSKAAGMQQYEVDSSQVRINDYIVTPKKIAQGNVKMYEVEAVKFVVPPSNRLTYFSTTVTFATMYASDHFTSPWSLTKAPVDTISIYKVKKTAHLN